MKKLAFLTIIIFVFMSCKTDQKNETSALSYPETKKVDTITNYFGTEISDPYRWLEDDMSDETAAWVESQNNVTFDYLVVPILL